MHAAGVGADARSSCLQGLPLCLRGMIEGREKNAWSGWILTKLVPSRACLPAVNSPNWICVVPVLTLCPNHHMAGQRTQLATVAMTVRLVSRFHSLQSMVQREKRRGEELRHHGASSQNGGECCAGCSDTRVQKYVDRFSRRVSHVCSDTCERSNRRKIEQVQGRHHLFFISRFCFLCLFFLFLSSGASYSSFFSCFLLVPLHLLVFLLFCSFLSSSSLFLCCLIPF